MKKLRLLITEECDRKCPMCCNNLYNLAELKVETNFAHYNEIILTGGEPMLHPLYLERVIQHLRDHTGLATKIYLQTAKVDDLLATLKILQALDGISVTIHNEQDIKPFQKLDRILSAYSSEFIAKRSLRLYVFDGIETPEFINPWKVQHMVWLEDPQLPENEVFKRFAFIN